MELLVLVGALGTSLIVLTAGVEHAVGQAKLRSRIRTHEVFGRRWVRPVSVGLPVLELLVAVGFFWSLATTNRTGLVASLLLQTALYLSFGGYLAMVVRAGNAGLPCGCGPAELPVGRAATARAIGLAVLSSAAALGSSATDIDSFAVRADARSLLACVAGSTIAILLVILPSARRMELPVRHQTQP